MVNESRKMLHIPDLMVSCTSVRIPALRAHSESLNMEFAEDITPEEARAILSAAPGVTVVDDPEAKLYPMPVDAPENMMCLPDVSVRISPARINAVWKCSFPETSCLKARLSTQFRSQKICKITRYEAHPARQAHSELFNSGNVLRCAAVCRMCA